MKMERISGATNRNGFVMRRVIGIAGVCALTGAVVLGAATTADAAVKKATSVKLSSITHVATTANPGASVVSGEKVILKGSASANLVGQRLAVQIKTGSTWVAYPGTGVVTSSRAYAITTRATGVGSQPYRVRFVGTKKLKESSATRSVTVWQWFPLVDEKIVALRESFGGNAPHVVSQVNVAGKGFSRLLAGSSVGNKTASTEFNLGYHCQRFTSVIGLGDKSPTGATGLFSVYFDGNRAAQQSMNLGAASSLDLDASGFFRIRLENSTTVQPGTGLLSVVTAWPEAAVLCDAKPGVE